MNQIRLSYSFPIVNQFLRNFLLNPASPTNSEPRRSMVAGSGIGSLSLPLRKSRFTSGCRYLSAMAVRFGNNWRSRFGWPIAIFDNQGGACSNCRHAPFSEYFAGPSFTGLHRRSLMNPQCLRSRCTWEKPDKHTKVLHALDSSLPLPRHCWLDSTQSTSASKSSNLSQEGPPPQCPIPGTINRRAKSLVCFP